jgi:hypothetical protein
MMTNSSHCAQINGHSKGLFTVTTLRYTVCRITYYGSLERNETKQEYKNLNMPMIAPLLLVAGNNT